MRGKTLTGIILSFLVMLVLFLSNCGGSSDNGAIPDVASPQQTQQNLVNKDISGYVYHVSSLSSSETDEEEEDFSILEVPITSEDGFITQVNEYFQTEPSSRAGSPERVELQNAFTEKTSCFVPLNSWNSGATLFSVYSDSENSSSIPVGAEGEISSSVPVDAGDDLISLEIGSSEGEYYEVETISNSDLMAADESGINLKSCPKQIIIKPGECEIFKVFSKPSANLYDAGLQFTLANPEYGCVAGPIFIKCKGNKQTGVAYGIVYAKKNLDTPLDMAINVSTAGGQSLSIPVQIVKKTAVASGKVYAGGPVVKGHVVSQGPKSQCKINADGTYSLPKVWQGTGRKITATWWVMEGNKKVRHRETRYVDVLGDVIVNFGVVPTPTPRPPSSSFYDQQIAEVIYQFEEWKANFGNKQAIQMTLSWLNNELPEAPPIPDEIVKAHIASYSDTEIWVHFEGGMAMSIITSSFNYYQEDVDARTLNKQAFLEKQKANFQQLSSTLNATSNITTVGSDDILILSPFMWEKELHDLATLAPTEINVEYDMVNELKERNYQGEIKTKITHWNDLKFDLDNPVPIPEKPQYHYFNCYLSDTGSWDNIVTPGDFEYMGNYGIVYILTHGGDLGDELSIEAPEFMRVICSIYVKDDDDDTTLTETDKWTDALELFDDDKYKHGWWHYTYGPQEIEGRVIYIKVLCLTKYFFEFLNSSPNNLDGSLIYMNSCWSSELKDYFTSAKAYLYNDKPAYPTWANAIAYYFFYYMIDKPVRPTEYLWYDEDEIGEEALPYPMHANEAVTTLSSPPYRINPDPRIYPDGEHVGCNECELNIQQKFPDDKIYFPTTSTVIVHEE